MFRKVFVVVSLSQPYPLYLSLGKVPLFNNFQVSGVDLHFSIDVSGAVECETWAEAEVWIGGIIYLHPRFNPLTIIHLYRPEILIAPEG